MTANLHPSKDNARGTKGLRENREFESWSSGKRANDAATKGNAADRGRQRCEFQQRGCERIDRGPGNGPETKKENLRSAATLKDVLLRTRIRSKESVTDSYCSHLLDICAVRELSYSCRPLSLLSRVGWQPVSLIRLRSGLMRRN